MTKKRAHRYNRRKSLLCTGSISQRLLADSLRCIIGQRVTIDVLPDDVLLAIFDFHVFKYQDILQVLHAMTDDVVSWQSLVHVCRRWRCLVFRSPRRLNLQLHCDPGASTRRTLDVWPALPLLIEGDVSEATVDNVVAELKHTDRICHLDLYFDATSQIEIEKLWTAMQVPFPELTILCLEFKGVPYVPVLPDPFLGGSAPRLRYFELTSTPFPGLPKLLFSATHLVHLYLYQIPHSGYISPVAMATCLSMLTSLESLRLLFESPQSSPDQENRHSPPPTRFVLSALSIFLFKGVNEYLEELVAQIDTPRLRELSATFFNDIDFDTPELARFVSRSSILKAPDEVHVTFGSLIASVTLQPQASNSAYFEVKILCREPSWQLSSLAQICTTSFLLLATVEDLFIYNSIDPQLDWKDGIENIEWLELLLPFTAVKNLYLSEQYAQRIAPALQEITGGGTTEVLSALQNLYLEGFRQSKPKSVEKDIERFISARQSNDHPVVLSEWERDLGSITDVGGP
jgi:hypothetical protein